MNHSYKMKLSALSFFLFSFHFVFGQGGEAGSSLFIWSLIVIAAVLVVFAVITVSDNLLQFEAKKSGLDTEANNYGLFPRISSKPSHVDRDGNFKRLKKGYNLNIAGKPVKRMASNNITRFAIKPQDFIGISPIPKVTVEVGNEVKAGDVIFFDKKRPEVKYVSPVSGEVVEIRRGAKRAITHVVILADKEQKYTKHEVPNENASREELVEYLLSTGGWTLLNQRPFDVIPDPNVVPKNIFVSTFTTNPLGADQSFCIEGKEVAFQKGLDVLNSLTEGKVYLGLDGNRGSNVSSAFTNATGVEKTYFSGKHPAGNVGVQIHHTSPIKGADAVWTLKPQEVATLGGLFIDGVYDASRVVAIGGGEVLSPAYVDTYQGASVNDLLAENLKSSHVRKISGDVLSGEVLEEDDFLSFRHDQISVIKEGDNYELFGWLLPIKPRPSISGTFPNFLMKNHEFEVDTNTHGEKRAFVVTGQYESVLPMDIYPQHLMKAIITNDFEKMEGLGLTELSEEDVAICEFVCTSKMPLQKILREGLDTMREQL